MDKKVKNSNIIIGLLGTIVITIVSWFVGEFFLIKSSLSRIEIKMKDLKNEAELIKMIDESIKNNDLLNKYQIELLIIELNK